MGTQESTPRPWATGFADTHRAFVNAKNVVVCKCDEGGDELEHLANPRANAKFIVTAVNHHDALVSVCRDLVAWAGDGPNLKPLPAILATMRSLLQSATGAPEDAT